MNSSTGMVELFSIIDHLLIMLSIARSRDMFVNREITSSEIDISAAPISIFDRDFFNSKLLCTWLSLKGKLSMSILCMNFAMGYRAVFTEETMILNEMFFLWISDKPYALGRFVSWEQGEISMFGNVFFFPSFFDYGVEVFFYVFYWIFLYC